MSKVDIYLLYNSNIKIEKIDIIKPNSLKDLYEQLKQKLKYIPERYEIFIVNGKRSHLIDNCILNNGENTITLLIKNKLINLSYMFSWCNSLSNIEELKYLDVKYSNDFSYMFCGCSSLSDISPLKHWNVSSGKNFSSMFCNCTALSDLNPIKNWNVSNGNNFQYMFYGCYSLTDLHPLQNWNVSNRGEFEKMFSGCSLILDAEPIPNWSISKEKFDSLI